MTACFVGLRSKRTARDLGCLRSAQSPYFGQAGCTEPIHEGLGAYSAGKNTEHAFDKCRVLHQSNVARGLDLLFGMLVESGFPQCHTTEPRREVHCLLEHRESFFLL